MEGGAPPPRSHVSPLRPKPFRPRPKRRLRLRRGRVDSRRL